jgi:hypothetical protein
MYAIGTEPVWLQFLGGEGELMKGPGLCKEVLRTSGRKVPKGTYPAIRCADVLTPFSHWPSGGWGVYLGHLP